MNDHSLSKYIREVLMKYYYLKNNYRERIYKQKKFRQYYKRSLLKILRIIHNLIDQKKINCILIITESA